MEKSKQDRFYKRLIVSLSIAIPLAVFVLMVLPEDFRISGVDVSKLPLFHACLNAITSVLLIGGFFYIKNGNRKKHKTAMLSAFAMSCIFLVSYVIYHSAAESTPFGGEGWIRPVYFFILISHIVLATTVVPLALFAIYRGLVNDVEKHKRIVRWAFPVWLYVSVTGVLVYLFMAPYYS